VHPHAPAAPEATPGPPTDSPAEPVTAEGAAPPPAGLAEGAAEIPVSDPTAWGRVDEDGAVWVRTADGERPVGSYPGVATRDALAYFGRKYDELVGQVMLLEQRVRGTDLPPKDALAGIAKLTETITEAAAVGDLQGLCHRLDALLPVVEERKAAADELRTRRRTEAREAKDRIVTEAEELAQSSEWKRTGDRLRELLEDWKKIPRLERGVDDTLWKRFSTARSAFDKRRRQHFAALDTQREESHARKERLIAEAETLAGSTDWGPTGGRLRELMTEWKAAGRARRDLEDELWGRFRAAQDRFFAARNAVFGERDAELRVNAERKEALLAEAEALLPVRDVAAAKAVLRRIQDRWEQIGHVPREHRERTEGRLHRVEQAVRDSEEATWKRSNPEALARARATVTALQQSIAKLHADAEKARRHGDERKAAQAQEAASARASWLVEAEKTLAEFS
jgi:hypothetical protein